MYYYLIVASFFVLVSLDIVFFNTKINRYLHNSFFPFFPFSFFFLFSWFLFLLIFEAGFKALRIFCFFFFWFSEFWIFFLICFLPSFNINPDLLTNYFQMSPITTRIITSIINVRQTPQNINETKQNMHNNQNNFFFSILD